MATPEAPARIVARTEPATSRLTRRLVAIPTAIFALTLTSRAGTFTETLDAGALPETAPSVSGGGALDFVLGALGNSMDVDMFKIHIANPAGFSATTDNSNATGWAYNTQLFLFDAAGMGVWANDDINRGNRKAYNPRSTLVAGSGGAPATAGVYYIAISGWDRDPVNSAGNIFKDDTNRVATLQPTGPGKALPIAAWDGAANLSSDIGSYQIALTGAEFVSAGGPVPEPGMLLILGIGGAIVHSSSRRTVRSSA